MKFIVSAPGKIILTGEHSVVYGYKAIASSINLRCQAQIVTEDIDKSCVTLRLNVVPYTFSISKEEFTHLKDSLGNCKRVPTSSEYQSLLYAFLNDKLLLNENDQDFVKPGIAVFLDLYIQTIIDFLPVDITIESEFSYGCGLGSSAAYSTVLSTSFLILSEKISTNQNQLSENHLNLISDLAFRGEQIVHGTPSGIDNSISTFGKGIVFQRLRDSVIKKNISIPNLKVLLVDTQVKRCTKTVVKYVRKMLDEDPLKYDNWFKEINDITESLEMVLLRHDDYSIANINYLIEENHRVLKSLGVSHPTIEEIVNILRCYGISAKLTGAGCGGCVYGLINEVPSVQIEKAINYLTENGYRTYVTSLSCHGVDIRV